MAAAAAAMTSAVSDAAWATMSSRSWDTVLLSGNSPFGALDVGTYALIGPAQTGWNLSWRITSWCFAQPEEEREERRRGEEGE